jgi:hypothetical protein
MGGSPENTVLHPLHQVQFATHAKLKVDDYYHNGARRRLRLHEKGGKEHDMPVHHLLERILDEYIVAAGLQSGQPLFAENALALISPPGLSFRSPAQVTFAHDAHHRCGDRLSTAATVREPPQSIARMRRRPVTGPFSPLRSPVDEYTSPEHRRL